MKSIIKIESLHQEFDGITVLDDINIEIYYGKIVSIIGPSGSGKSTLLRSINLLNKPTSGKIYYHDEDIIANKKKHSYYRSKIGMVFQSFNLYNNYSVLDNCTLGPRKVLKIKKNEAEETAKKYLEMVGLIDKINAAPNTLSGGQKQRVSIARSLCMDPEIILFDEPTSALDPEMVGEVLDVIRKLKNSGKTLIIVTHEMAFAKEISDHVIFMADGNVVEQGSPEEVFNNPKNERTRQFFQRFTNQ